MTQGKRDTVPRHLIVSADERSWKFDRPVLFLGEWCRRYDRRSVWHNLDAIVAEPYGLDSLQKERDLARTKALAANLLVDLANMLNEFHGTRHSVRYWQILIGHWLIRASGVVINRWATVELALEDYVVSGVTLPDASNLSLATTDALAFISATNDDEWNQIVYAKIFALRSRGDIPIEFARWGDRAFHPAPAVRPYRARLYAGAAQAAGWLLRVGSRSHDALIINSYLPRTVAMKLELSLGQIPQSRVTPPLQTVKPDPLIRTKLMSHFQTDGSALDRSLKTMVIEMIPATYLEGYNLLLAQAKALGWPKTPKFIFTSNSFDHNEIFKAWAAEKVSDGVPYFIGQHGNNYGTTASDMDEWVCVAMSDKFVTWGWADGNPKHAPAFIFKTAEKRIPKRNPRGGLVLIHDNIPYRWDPWDVDATFNATIHERFRFVETLPRELQRQAIIRLHGNHASLRGFEKMRWEDRRYDVAVDDGVVPLRKLIKKSRLVVHAYDSTGILESLAQNTPMLCFWLNPLEHLRPSARPYYQLLIDAGLLFGSGEEAAAKTAEIWDRVSEWWASEQVQSARLRFCERYARHVDDPVSVLKKHLLQPLTHSQ